MPSPVTRSYTAHGFGLTISFESDEFLRTTDQTVRYHGFKATDVDAHSALTIRIGSDRTIRTPDSSEHVLTHPSGVRLLRADGTIFLVRGDAVMRIDPGGGMATAAIDAASRGASTFTVDSTLYLFLTFALVLLLQARNLFVLHAAALAPSERDGILVVAPSGSGKSTLAMRLIESGWKYVSDDSILVQDSSEGVIASPFRRDATVFSDSLAQFRKAAGHGSPLFSDESKSIIDMDSAYPGQRLEAMTPAVLIFPSITGEKSTRLEPTDAASAMVGLISQASFLAADSPRVSQLMNVLKRLVEQTSHMQLHAGTDLRDDPAGADQLLSGLV